MIIPFCPVCVVSISAGLGLSRWLKIDDLISGLWIGALILSLAYWSLDLLRKRKISFKFDWLFVTVLFYFLTSLPLSSAGILFHPENKIFGIDRLILGILAGSLTLLASAWFHNFLKAKNQGKSFFPFQKVFVPIAFLSFLSLIFYFLTY